MGPWEMWRVASLCATDWSHSEDHGGCWKTQDKWGLFHHNFAPGFHEGSSPAKFSHMCRHLLGKRWKPVHTCPSPGPSEAVLGAPYPLGVTTMHRVLLPWIFLPSLSLTEDEMVGRHHWLNGHEFEETLGVGDGQGGLACGRLWDRKESDTAEQLNWTEARFAFYTTGQWIKWGVEARNTTLFGKLAD